MADPDPISSTLDGPSSAVSPTVLDSPMDGGKEASWQRERVQAVGRVWSFAWEKRVRKDEPKGVVASEEIVIKGGMRGPAPATSLYDCGGNGWLWMACISLSDRFDQWEMENGS